MHDDISSGPSTFRTSPASRRVRALDRQFAQSEAAFDSTVQPAENEKLTASLYKHGFDRPSQLVLGKILYVFPYAHWYRVQLDVGGVDIPCTSLTETSVQPFSVKSASPIAVGSQVLVCYTPGDTFGLILGCVPKIVTENSQVYSDWISQGSNGGCRRERYYTQFPDLFEDSGRLIDFSDGRPVDATAVGEWARLNDLGCGFFLGPFMLFMRVDELCGLYLHYLDRVLSLRAYNYDFLSAVSEAKIRNDNGEGLHYAGYTPYPWEALGLLLPTATAHRVTSPEDVHYRSPYGTIEPLHDDQQPVFRLEEFRGYLGQGYMRQLQLPRASGEVGRESDQKSGLGVFREQLSLDGSWSVSSAHSIGITKRLLIPIAKRIAAPEDATGDDLTSQESSETSEGAYRFAGIYGEGSPHQVRDALPPPGDLPQVWSVAAVLDAMAYTNNWKGMHPFHYHERDFHTPQEDESEFPSLQQPPRFSDLQHEQWLPSPPAIEQQVDHRHSASYHATQSGLFLLPDGGVVIRDGYGSEIRMAGGNVEITAPGDVFIRSGRSVIQYAGDDAVIRARNSVDITATDHDVRLKAERNLECLAGNGGKPGRLLLDCQSAGPQHDVVGKQGEDVEQTGIILKAANSEVSALASDIYLRTGGGGGLGGGQITLDAGQGRGVFQTVSNFVVHNITNAMSLAIPGGNTSAAYQFGRSATVLPNSLIVNGNATVKGPIQAKGHIVAVDGDVGGLKANDPGYAQSLQAFSSLESDLARSREQLNSFYREQVRNRWYGNGRLGSDRVVENTMFAPRNDEQLRTVNFKLVEAYWQQLAGAHPNVWRENPIRYQGLAMMPHPGLKKWQTDQAFLRVKLKLHDVLSGRDRARGEAYESPETGEWIQQKAEQNYAVTS